MSEGKYYNFEEMIKMSDEISSLIEFTVMSEEEIDAFDNEISKLPQFEGPITATTCEINVDDPFDKTRAFRKIPDYNELIKDNHKKQQEIERLNNIINELEHDFESYDLDYLRETYQSNLADFIETGLKRIQELKRR